MEYEQEKREEEGKKTYTHSAKANVTNADAFNWTERKAEENIRSKGKYEQNLQFTPTDFLSVFCFFRIRCIIWIAWIVWFGRNTKLRIVPFFSKYGFFLLSVFRLRICFNQNDSSKCSNWFYFVFFCSWFFLAKFRETFPRIAWH